MTCYRSLPRMLGLLLLAVLMTALSAWCTTQPQVRAQVFGWLGVAFFGFGMLVLARQVLRRGPVIVLDNLSITDHRSADGPLFWDQIQSIWVGSVQSSKFLCLELKDPEALLSRWSAKRRAFAKANAALGFPAVTISFTGLSPGLEDVLIYLRSTQPTKFTDSSRVFGNELR